MLKRPDLFRYVLEELPMDHPPGQKWEYNNSGLSLLSPVVHKATGQNIDQILDEQVFKKIGIPRDDWTLGRSRRHAAPLLGPAHHGPQPGPVRLAVSEQGSVARQQGGFVHLGGRGDGRLARFEQAVWLSVVEQPRRRLARRAGATPMRRWANSTTTC